MWSDVVQRYLLKMPKKVLNLELSSGAFSAPTLAGVAARELFAELSVDTGAEAAWAFSGARSAMEVDDEGRRADGFGRVWEGKRGSGEESVMASSLCRGGALFGGCS